MNCSVYVTHFGLLSLLAVLVSSIPIEKALICWTCLDQISNERCNGWAPNVICTRDNAICETIHQFVPGVVKYGTNNASLVVNTLRVDKLCISREKCKTPGCYKLPNGNMECRTCCDESYCNELVAVNQDQAIQLSLYRNISHSIYILNSTHYILLLICAILHIQYI